MSVFEGLHLDFVAIDIDSKFDHVLPYMCKVFSCYARPDTLNTMD